MSRYEWDKEKALRNAARHGVTFDEARDAVGHPLATEEPDPGHSLWDERVRVTGWSPLGRVLVVVVSISGRNPRIVPHGAPRSANTMPTPADELDPELEIPEFVAPKGSRPSRFITLPGEKTEICVDGAVGYQLRSIPSNGILARFESTLEAWPVIIGIIEGGRSPRTLSLDAIDADGTTTGISAGPRLESFARLNNGEAHPYPSRAAGHARKRVAESAP